MSPTRTIAAALCILAFTGCASTREQATTQITENKITITPVDDNTVITAATIHTRTQSASGTTSHVLQIPATTHAKSHGEIRIQSKDGYGIEMIVTGKDTPSGMRYDISTKVTEKLTPGA